MTEEMEKNTFNFDQCLKEWGAPIRVAICNHCDWSFLVHEKIHDLLCPHCFQSNLEILEGDISALSHLSSPEIVLPIKVTSAQISQKISEFSGGIPYPPEDLRNDHLQSRLKSLFLPIRLVDVQSKAEWKAEMGFNYQVISHQERFDQNQANWKTQQIEEQRIRWEERLGTLDRAYHNITAPATEDDERIRRMMGNFDYPSAQPYDGKVLEESFVRLPNRCISDAWQSVLPELQALASGECRKACDADHVREFQWEPVFDNHHWTLLLQPVMTTFYLDDDQKIIPLMIHGQNGSILGIRRASMQRAKQVSLYIFLAALAVFILSLVSLILVPLLPVLAGLSAIGVGLAFVVGLAGLIPLITVWLFNRSQA